MEVEHVARVGFTARGTAQQQGDLAVGPGLLGQVIVNDQGVFTAVAVVLAHGATGKRRQELHGRRIGGGSRDHDSVLHGAVLFQLAHHGGNGGGLLADGDIDTFNAGAFLVDDGIDGDSGLTDLAVADDQFPLAAADGDHGVNSLEADLHGLVHRLAGNNTRGDFFQRIGHGRIDWALAVNGVTQGIDHAALQLRSDRYFQDASGAAAGLAFSQALVIAQYNCADRIALEVQGHAIDTAVKFDHLAVHHIGQAVNADDAVGYGYHRTFIASLAADIKLVDALLDDLANLRWIQLLHALFLNPTNSMLRPACSACRARNRRSPDLRP